MEVETQRMPSPAYHRFVASTHLDYEKWHDGVPYDMAAFAAMSPRSGPR
jgi:hypothetical protein